MIGATARKEWTGSTAVTGLTAVNALIVANVRIAATGRNAPKIAWTVIGLSVLSGLNRLQAMFAVANLDLTCRLAAANAR
jgi:hypothetical protein